MDGKRCIVLKRISSDEDKIAPTHQIHRGKIKRIHGEVSKHVTSISAGTNAWEILVKIFADIHETPKGSLISATLTSSIHSAVVFAMCHKAPPMGKVKQF